MSSKITKSDIIKEIIRCGKDPTYFIDTHAKIQHPVKGLLPFHLYPYQKDIVTAYTKHRKNILLKARQLGVTTVTAAYIAWFVLFHRDKNVLIVATKQETSKNMIRIVRNIFKYLPKWMVDIGKIKIDNRHSIELENGSRVKAVTTSSDVGRSESVSFLVIDECAFIKNFDEIWTGLYPVINTGGSIALFSSPNGTGNAFHRLFEQARNNENGFNCRYGTYANPNNPQEVVDDMFPWWVHPEHDEVWFKSETAGKSPRDVAQEFLCSFNMSGETFIYHEDIAKLKRAVREPEEYFHLERNVWIWEKPRPNAAYIISCDVSRGDAEDFSAFHVIRLDMHPLSQVAEYKGKIKPDQLGLLLIAVSQFYNNAIIAPENNSGWSGQTILKIEENGYPYIYYSRRRKAKEKDQYAVDPYYAMHRNDFLPGYAVTASNRVPMLAKLEQYIRLNEIEVRSSRLVAEIETFIVNEFNRPEAMRGYNDDLVLALAGGLWVREESYMHSYRSDEVSKALLGAMSTSSNSTKNYADFNFSSNMLDRARVESYNAEKNKMVMRNGESYDLSWLTKG